ncbi:MAG TPA: response regulator [Candidatus Limnocylindrales bacterium]|nr:response regulator [Candidatus Limnocylindrales bacterium]
MLALVVDDSMLIRHTVCRFLETRGFTVESATNGVEALEMLDGIQPDIIVTDLQMPKMDGLELINALRSRPNTAAIPVVILAGKQGPEQTSAMDGHYVIYKDIDIVAQLGRAVETVLPGSCNP